MTITNKREKPLIHLLHNHVTLNDVVNMIMAVGGTAVCGESEEEAAELTSLSDALLINTGMPTREKLRAMILAGQRANQLEIPVLLDPVGAGASSFRREVIRELLFHVRFCCIRGNNSEIASLCDHSFTSKGPESVDTMLTGEEIKALALRSESIVVATGKRDIVTDGGRIFEYPGASPLLKEFTGGGCMLSGVLAVFLAKSGKTRPVKLQAVQSALDLYRKNAKDSMMRTHPLGMSGTLSYKNALIDGMSLYRDEIAEIFEKQ
ncbi:MAG: hydroxyethylthiazole kinase [Peptostreptococcaceae bacterium]|nr:hydroxyethylthiazole kinase [Peptostreptococcaceae bacterium]